MTALDLESDDVRLLADLGYMAVSHGLDVHAQAIFLGLRAVRPELEAAPVGLALVHLLRDEVEAAIKLLREAGPGDAARTFLGIALARHGDLEEARRLLSDVATSAKGTAHGTLAAETLAALTNGPARGA